MIPLCTVALLIVLLVAAIVIHEAGHVLAAWLLGMKLEKLTVYWNRIAVRISPGEPWKEIVVAISGPLANLLVWFFLSGELRRMGFHQINLFYGTLNLLPIRGFDGRRILERVSARLRLR